MHYLPQTVDSLRSVKSPFYLLSDVEWIERPHPLHRFSRYVSELLIFVLVALVAPLPPKGLKYSLDSGLVHPSDISHDAPPSADSGPRDASLELAGRVLLRLEEAEKKELDPWMRDDIRIAWITVFHASQGHSQPHVVATYRVLGIHPDKVWPAIVARREAMLGAEYGNFFPASSPKKPCASVREIPFPKNSDQKKRAS